MCLITCLGRLSPAVHRWIITQNWLRLHGYQSGHMRGQRLLLETNQSGFQPWRHSLVLLPCRLQSMRKYHLGWKRRHGFWPTILRQNVSILWCQHQHSRPRRCCRRSWPKYPRRILLLSLDERRCPYHENLHVNQQYATLSSRTQNESLRQLGQQSPKAHWSQRLWYQNQP